MSNNITLENYDKELEAICNQSVHERDTKTVLNLFFTHSRWNDERIRKNGSSLDNPQLYQYEISLGKKIFEMDSDELLAFVKSRGKRNGRDISPNSYRCIHSLSSAVWNYYIKNIDPIRNPWIKNEMRIDTVIESLGKDSPKISTDYLEEIINDGRMIYINDDQHYNYGELLVRLFYAGVPSAKDIIQIKEEQVDLENHLIRFSYRDIYLSDRTCKLLKKVHKMGNFVCYRQTYFPTPYNGSYIPIIVKKNFVDSLNARPIESVALNILGILKTFTDKRLTAREIYKLGFYDFMVGEIGQDAVYTILMQTDTESSRILMKLVGEYGYTLQTTAGVRRDMKEFL